MITEKERLQVRIEVLRELRKRLNGKCGNTCPHNLMRIYVVYSKIPPIKFNTTDGIWDCENCTENFSFISCLERRALCPCKREPNPEELFLRLDEVIEEIEENLNAL